MTDADKRLLADVRGAYAEDSHLRDDIGALSMRLCDLAERLDAEALKRSDSDESGNDARLDNWALFVVAAMTFAFSAVLWWAAGPPRQPPVQGCVGVLQTRAKEPTQ